MAKPAPPWLDKYLDRTRRRLGLDAWNFTCALVEQIDRKRPSTIGRVYITDGTMWAHFKFDEEIAPNVEGYERATHELLHVFFREEERRIDALRARLPKRYRRWIDQFYWNPHEEQISQLAYWLSRRWRPKPLAQAGRTKRKHAKKG